MKREGYWARIDQEKADTLADHLVRILIPGELWRRRGYS
jgi:hypothetical protein